MKVLLTGGAGYIGSVLTRDLSAVGHQVRVVDLGLFGLDHIRTWTTDIIPGDIRVPQPEWFQDIDVVMNLAGLSNDPQADYSPALNFQINALGPILMYLAATRYKVDTFIQASTCSIYGQNDYPMPETAPVSPRHYYAQAKYLGEMGLALLAGCSHSRWVALRMGTAGGASPRMRFDLAVNTMVKTALAEDKIVIGPAKAWRPLLHIRDAAAGFMAAAENRQAHGVINLLTDNYQIMEIGQRVLAALGRWGYHPQLEVRNETTDRDYQAAPDRQHWLGFMPGRTIEEMAEEVIEWCQIHKPAFNDPRYYNIQIWEKHASSF